MPIVRLLTGTLRVRNYLLLPWFRCPLPDLNRRLLAYHANTLPTELKGHVFLTPYHMGEVFVYWHAALFARSAVRAKLYNGLPNETPRSRQFYIKP